MNKIAEIIENKNRKTILEESIYETYTRELCTQCKNRNNNKDLCKITVNLKREAQCVNYEKCMQNKCKTCKDSEKCNDKNNTKNRKSIRKDRV